MKIIISIALTIIFSSCGTSKPTVIYFVQDSSLRHGDTDYWYTNHKNYIQVIDTVRGTVYYYPKADSAYLMPIKWYDPMPAYNPQLWLDKMHLSKSPTDTTLAYKIIDTSYCGSIDTIKK